MEYKCTDKCNDTATNNVVLDSYEAIWEYIETCKTEEQFDIAYNAVEEICRRTSEMIQNKRNELKK